MLPYHFKTKLTQSICEKHFVNGFKQARPQILVQIKRHMHHQLGNLVFLHPAPLCVLCVPLRESFPSYAFFTKQAFRPMALPSILQEIS